MRYLGRRSHPGPHRKQAGCLYTEDNAMNRFDVLLTSCAMIACPAILSAQGATLEICNKGPVQISVAYAARIQLFITGYRWETSGFYTVDAGACEVVYDKDYDDAGPITPQSGARIALIAETGGAYRALHNSENDKDGWMQSGTGQICTNLGASNGFRYNEPAGDPAANCSGGTLVPVAYDFMPTGPGDYSYTTYWDGRTSSVAVAKAASSTSVAASPRSGSEISYFCASTDKRKVIFASDIFNLPDAGSQADNFLTFMRMQLRFQMFLVTHYDFPGDDGLVACIHTPVTGTSFAEMSAKERNMETNLAAANKHMVKTGWTYVADAGSDTVAQAVTEADVHTLTPGGRAALFNWVQKDVATYLAASRTGFNAYKSGDVILSQGYRMWTSSVKPEIARGCWVVQGDSATTMSCAIPIESNYERAYYNELVQDVAASLPAGWSAEPPNPFGGSLPSSGYRSNNGAHGEVWLEEPKDDTYELHFQLVSAPVRH